ncbi:hypothetical protein LEMLEM_LOCUS6012 [Lemmus lemmus]
MDEGLKSFLNQEELVTQYRNVAEKLQHHFSAPDMRTVNLQSELDQVTAQEESFLQTELQQQEH